MRSNLVVAAATLLISASSFAYQLACEQDYRPVDGGLVRFMLNISENGRATAYILEQSDSPASSHKEESTLRALNCTKSKNAGFISIDCKGVFTVNVSEMELAGTPGMGFSHRTVVNTSFKDKSFAFDGKVSAPLKDTCVEEEEPRTLE